MDDRLSSKSSVVSKSTDNIMLKKEANSVVGRLTSDILLYFLMWATKTFWKRLIEYYPTMLQFLSEILPLTLYQWIFHSTSQPFPQLPTITIFTSHSWSAKLLFCMDGICDVPTHGKKINRNKKKIYREKYPD